MEFIDLAKQQKLIREKIDERIKKILDQGQYIMGEEVFDLEQKLADYIGMNNCISCSSGTDALLIPLMAKNIGPGDAVLTSTFTYIATAEVIALLGATPIFVDIYEKTYNMNPNEIEKGIILANKKGLNPKAIIPVDLFGLPARFRLIDEIAKEHNLLVIEDFAQGFGGKIRNKRAGSFGDVSSTSFYPAKPLGCYGDGGAIFTDDDKLAKKMRSIRVHGGGENKYDNVRIGLNGRLDTIQAAILLEKLAIFDFELEKRGQIANYYKNNIHKKYVCPYLPQDYMSSWAQFSILSDSNINRGKIMQKLKSFNIPSAIFYNKPLHLQKVFGYLNYKKGDFPVSEHIANRIFSLPMHPYLELVDQNKIIEILNDI